VAYFDLKPVEQPGGLWKSKAREVVLDSLRKARLASRKNTNEIHTNLHAFLDQGTGAMELVKARARVTHPQVAREWTKQAAGIGSGIRLFGLVPMMVNTLASTFHHAPETYLTVRGERLPEDHPEVMQWREDSRDLPGLLYQLDRWCVLFRSVVVQPTWINGRIKWCLYPPYQVAHVETNASDPTSIASADWITFELPQKDNSSQFVTWTPGEMFYHTEDGRLLDNPLFMDGLNRYETIPAAIWRASYPCPGEFWDEPRAGWLAHELAVSSAVMDLDHVCRFQCFSIAVASGYHSEEALVIGPGAVITSHESPGDFSFDFKNPGSAGQIKALTETIENQLRLAAVTEGLPADIWSALGAARSSLAKQQEAHALTLRRQERIPMYMTALRETWDIHKRVANYHWQQGRVRYRDETRLEMVVANVTYPRDQYQEAQQNELEFKRGISSPVDVVASRHQMNRTQAEARVRDNLTAGQLPADEGGIPSVEYTGIQIQSAVNIVTAVKRGELTPKSGAAMLQAFLGVTSDLAAQMLGD